ncbi:unnamed protein product [Calypogeia fissa]
MPYMALQCFSCHHMQVKEVRKSSSSARKWSCAICNEKQSVRKVFSTSDTAKEVRKFVQQFNLTAGQAAYAEGISRLETTGSPTEDSSYDYRYQEDQEGQMNRAVGNDNYAGQKKSFKWDKYLPDEEQVCSGDEFQHTYDDTRFTTALPEPTSRRRTRPRSSSSPPQKRPLRGFTTPREDTDAELESLIPGDNRQPQTYTSGPGNSSKYQEGCDFGSEGSTPLGKSSSKFPAGSEGTRSLPTLGSDCSPKDVKSCHAQVSQAQTSKWSKYLS